jgi:ferritin-like metal-binding protein YciE
MAVDNHRDALLFDLSLARAGERTALEMTEQGAGEVTDDRARTLLNEKAEETREKIAGLDQVFTLLGAQPQDLACPSMEGIRQELTMFRQQNPTPQFLTATILFKSNKADHTKLATYGLLVDKAIMLGQIQAAQILTTAEKAVKESSARIERLIHELLLESIADAPDVTIELAAAGGGAVPEAT